MQTCILHIGMPKTGTTSIQSNLSYSCPDNRFSLVSLDSFFGNQKIGEAFLSHPLEKKSVFFPGLTAGKLPKRRASARAYFDRALGKARVLKKTPIISAELMWHFEEEEFRSLVSFLNERGFRPHVYAYFRSQLDALSASLQQYVRVGYRSPIERFEVKPVMQTLSYRKKMILFESVFGRESTHFRIFDPGRFRDQCVVRDFCDWVGINLGSSKIAKVNESLNDNAVKLLNAASMYLGEQLNSRKRISRRLASIKWEFVVRLVQDIPGPPLRLHEILLAEYRDSLDEERSFIEKYFGQPFPISLKTESNEGAIRKIEDLYSFDKASLVWLSKLSGGQTIKNGCGAETAKEVGRQMMQLSPLRSPGVSARLLSDRILLGTTRKLAKFIQLT